jgi:hypothetical protein
LGNNRYRMGLRMPSFTFHAIFNRSLIWAVVALVAVGWGLSDVRHRASYDPATPMNHMTDLTVFTEAGAAFFDGRDPYTVSNPRGWHYLYPPLFAIAVAPLSRLDSQWQAVIWYFVSLGVAWGCCYESLRVLRMFKPAPVSDDTASDDTATGTADSLAPRGKSSGAPGWLVGFAAAAMLLPALNTLQRGQVGLLVTYCVLLGLRLTLGSRSWLGWAAGGIALALAITVKLTPILPALFLVALLGLPVVMGWDRRKLAPAAALLGGMAAGLVLFLLLLPAAAVGWTANLHHLQRWTDKVVLNQDVGGDNDLTYHSVRNQSLINAVYRLGNWIAYAWDGGPDDLAEPSEQPVMPMDQPIVHRMLLVVRLGLLVLLSAVGWRAARRGGALDVAAAYGAACIATLSISPLSWGHHYLLAAPALLTVPLWYCRQGRLRFAKSLAISACGVLWVHYFFQDTAGRAGLLGLGTTIWFLAAAIGMLQQTAAEKAIATAADGDHGKPAPELRAA